MFAYHLFKERYLTQAAYLEGCISYVRPNIIGGRQTEGNTNKSQCSSFLPFFSDCLPSGQSRPKNMDDYKHFRARICATAKSHPAVAKPPASRYRADAHQTDSAALPAYIRPAKRRIFIGGITNAHVPTYQMTERRQSNYVRL